MQTAKMEQRPVKEYITGSNMTVKIIPFLTNTRNSTGKKLHYLEMCFKCTIKNLKIWKLVLF